MNVTEIKHPLIRHKLGLLRCADVSVKQFRELISEIGSLMTFEVCKDLPLETCTIESWNGAIDVEQIAGKKLTLVPILRAGLGLNEGVLSVVPNARISVVGMYRDEQTLKPVPYFEKLTSHLSNRTALVVDPMLATGGSMIAAIDLLKEKGCKSIKAMVLVSAPEGIDALKAAHPDVNLYTACIDEKLNEQGYILPGLGDAGDKIFGTK